jgi:hypothetical protein
MDDAEIAFPAEYHAVLSSIASPTLSIADLSFALYIHIRGVAIK